jgi:hypothetical protein
VPPEPVLLDLPRAGRGPPRSLLDLPRTPRHLLQASLGLARALLVLPSTVREGSRSARCLHPFVRLPRRDRGRESRPRGRETVTILDLHQEGSPCPGANLDLWSLLLDFLLGILDLLSSFLDIIAVILDLDLLILGFWRPLLDLLAVNLDLTAVILDLVLPFLDLAPGLWHLLPGGGRVLSGSGDLFPEGSHCPSVILDLDLCGEVEARELELTQTGTMVS